MTNNIFRALSRFDMVVHSPSSHQACEEMVPTGIYCDILEELMSLPHPKPHERGHPHADFGHLVSGYDAGYYSYLAYVTL
jgi:metallopeptidase MepB